MRRGPEEIWSISLTLAMSPRTPRLRVLRRGGLFVDRAEALRFALGKAVTRAMRSFVRKFPQYALTGGKEREMLYLYEPADPISAMWAKLSVERPKFVSRSEAMAALPD